MEEDIKILEDIEIIEFTASSIYSNPEIVNKSLKNLIKRNKELEEENKKTRYLKAITEETALKNYISTSVIKEKIEKLEEKLKHYKEYDKLNLLEKINVDLIDAKVEVLQELLKEVENE